MFLLELPIERLGIHVAHQGRLSLQFAPLAAIQEGGQRSCGWRGSKEAEVWSRRQESPAGLYLGGN